MGTDLGDGPPKGLLERVSRLQTIEPVDGAVGQVEQVPQGPGGNQHEMIVGVHAVSYARSKACGQHVICHRTRMALRSTSEGVRTVTVYTPGASCGQRRWTTVWTWSPER